MLQNMNKEYIVKTLEETNELAKQVAEELVIGNVITLTGTLGAGKTFFTSCLINHILSTYNLPQQNILSPTFNIVKEYQIQNFSILHFDLSRLKNKNELYELDIENCFENGISIIEWPEIAEDIIYNIKYHIDIKIIQNNFRHYTITQY